MHDYKNTEGVKPSVFFKIHRQFLPMNLKRSANAIF